MQSSTKLRGFIALLATALLVLAWTQRHRITPVAAGSRAPAYAIKTIDGQDFSVEKMRGRVVVLNVWATWCKPCLAEMPALERLHQALSDKGLVVIGVGTDALQGGDVRKFAADLGITFRIAHDPERRIEKLYLVQGLPTTFVIDKQGRIDRKTLGAREWDDAEHMAYLERLLAAT